MTTYTRSKPCKTCGSAEFYISNHHCAQCARFNAKISRQDPAVQQARNSINAKWRKDNADYVRLASRARYELRLVEQTERREFIRNVINTYGFAEIAAQHGIDPTTANKYLMRKTYITEHVMGSFIAILGNLGRLICRGAA